MPKPTPAQPPRKTISTTEAMRGARIETPDLAPAAAQVLPQTAWYLDAHARPSGSVVRAAIVLGLGSKPGSLDLRVCRTDKLDGEQSFEDIEDVTYVFRARVEDWGPGAKYCCTELLPARERKQPAAPPAPPERTPPHIARRRADRQALEDREEPDELDALLNGVNRRAPAGGE